MRERPNGFLKKLYPQKPEEFIELDKEEYIEIADYIAELHGYLWRFVRIVYPSANGDLADHLDAAISQL